MFNWRNWQKSLASLVMLFGVGVLTFGDFSVSEGVAPDVTHEEVVRAIEASEVEPVNEAMLKHRQSEGYDLISADYRQQKQFEIDEEHRLEQERIAEEERLAEEARLAEEERLAEEARIAQEQEEARIAEEARKAEEARLAEQQATQQSTQQATQKASATTSQQTQQAPQQQQQAPQKQSAPQQSAPQQSAPQPQRTDGFNFHGYNFSIRTFVGSGQVPKETPHVYSWDYRPSHYLVEQVSPAGRVIQQLGMGDTVVVNGVSYVVTHIKRKVPNDENGYSVITSMGADITIQTCEYTKGANGLSDLSIWYLTRQ